MRRCLGCLLCLLLLWSRPAQAQIPVTDALVGAQTTISAIQNVITATNMVLSVANQVLELTPLDEILIAGEIVEDLALIGDHSRRRARAHAGCAGVAGPL